MEPAAYQKGRKTEITDHGSSSYVGNVSRDAQKNENFRMAYWTGKNLQATLMSIPPRGEIGAEIHPDTDQMIRVESGTALVKMGRTKDEMGFSHRMNEGEAVFVKSGTWHNVYNIGSVPLKLSSVYAPPQHPYGTVHRTSAEAEH